jgi:hypothetical protein
MTTSALLPVHDRAVAVVRLLQRYQLDLSTEKHLQAGIETAFVRDGVAFEREKRLSVKDIPDFLVDGDIVVECKLHNNSRKMAIYQQLARYAEYNEVKAIILAWNGTMGLPVEINGRPVFAASLSRGWL